MAFSRPTATLMDLDGPPNAIASKSVFVKVKEMTENLEKTK